MVRKYLTKLSSVLIIKYEDNIKEVEDFIKDSKMHYDIFNSGDHLRLLGKDNIIIVNSGDFLVKDSLNNIYCITEDDVCDYYDYDNSFKINGIIRAIQWDGDNTDELELLLDPKDNIYEDGEVGELSVSVNGYNLRLKKDEWLVKLPTTGNLIVLTNKDFHNMVSFYYG
jgi:hypothetical protein